MLDQAGSHVLVEDGIDSHGSGWSPSVIDNLGDVFAEDVSQIVDDRWGPSRTVTIDAVLDQYMAAGLIQHSTSSYSSPMVAIPKKDASGSITINYKKLNAISSLGQLPIPRVDEVLDSL